MSALCKALAAALKADLTLTGLLGTFNGLPAIFAEELAPPDATMPYSLVKRVSSTADNLLSRRGVAEVVDVHTFMHDGAGSTVLDAVEERLRQLLDMPASLPLVVPGRSVYSISVSGTTAGPYEPGIASLIVSLDVLMRRNS